MGEARETPDIMGRDGDPTTACRAFFHCPASSRDKKIKNPSTTPTPMPRQASSSAPVEVGLAEFRRTMREVGAEDVVDEILDLFAEDAPIRVAALDGAVASGNGDEIARAAHAFKSPAGAIRARGLESMLLDMELAGQAGAIDQARAAFDQVRPEVESVLQHLRLERGRRDPDHSES
jgi:HPt (histidine-containing phosphotransfer) domain-containing protein